MNVRPFPERVLNGVVRRGIRLPSALAAAQKHASLGRREAAVVARAGRAVLAAWIICHPLATLSPRRAGSREVGQVGSL